MWGLRLAPIILEFSVSCYLCYAPLLYLKNGPRTQYPRLYGHYKVDTSWSHAKR